MRENLDDLGYDNEVLDTTPKAQFKKEWVGKLDFIKIKHCCSTKDNIKRMRKQTADWEEIFTKHISDEGLLYKELLEFSDKKMNNPIKNGQETWEILHRRHK